MTVVKTVAAYEIVQAAYPHPVTERDELGIAVGKAIDGALSRYSHEFNEARRPTAAAMNRLASQMLDEGLAETSVTLTPADRERELTQVAGVLQAFRRSEVMGMRRPKSRLVLVNDKAGFYAQPDYWNGRDIFYEMKSYRADPIPPAVDLQLRLFQLAFPRFRAILACYDRHATPVTTSLVEIGPIEPAESDRILHLALSTALTLGKNKVLEYVDSPILRYSVGE